MNNPYEYHEENLSERQAEIGFSESADTDERSLHELKKKVIRPVLLLMVLLTVIQLALLLILLITSITDILRRDHYFVIFIHAFPTMVTLALSLLLWIRQIRAIWVIIVLSFVPILYGILILLLLPAARFEEGETMIEITYFFVTAGLRLLYAPVVIVSCVRALDRYYTLKAGLKKNS